MRRGPAQRKVESWRHDSDDKAVMAVDIDAATDDILVGIEPADPQPVTQDHFIRISGVVFFRKNVASQHWRDTQDWK